MKQVFLKPLLFLLIISLLASCIVTKKKYDALMSQKLHQKDSLENIIKTNELDFNAFMNKTKQNEAFKLDMIDSLYKSINRLSSDTLNLKQSLRNTISEFEIEKNKLIQLRQDLEIKNGEVETLRQTLQKKDEELLSLQEMVEKNKKETDKLKKIISDALTSFDATELTVYQKNGKVYVSLEEKLLFKSGSSKVDPKGEDAIIKIAKVLENNPDISIVIEGHTDNVGLSDFNWNLSSQRALAVEKIIETNSKIDLSRITVAGRGMYSPIEPNTSEAGKRKNRRIEIILTPKLDQLYNILEN